MKNLKFKIYFSILFMLSMIACNEEEFLRENPLDFLTTGNAFIDFSDFESGLNDLYAKTREFNCGDFSASLYGTDIFFDARKSNNGGRFGDYNVSLNPTSSLVEGTWDALYKIIANANTILGRIEDSELTDEEKLSIEAEARFFRGYAYRHLAYYFGGVPLLIREVQEPRTDLTRTSKLEILKQVQKDLSFAADNLPEIESVKDGKVSNLVALHYLAETEISLGNYTEAITATSQVIDHPGTSLMMERFGSRAVEPGDVYWDLFRRDNQNRLTGNTEAIWVAQMEIDVPGGFLSTADARNFILERSHVPVVRSLNDPDGNNAMLPERSDANQGGRGVSFMQPTSFFENDLWTSDFDNDIRNSEYNYVRDVFYDDPSSPYFGMSAKDNPGPVFKSSTWRWYPWLTKVTTPGNHPDNLYENKELGLLKSSAGSTYRDEYYLRLPETYLLRAEAYLANGEPEKAAADINVVRARANAKPVAPEDVDIDYILDERARELSFEENRRITLQRLGKLVERVRLYNDYNSDEIEDHHEVWPIPFAEIEANVNATLEQNTGY